MLTLRILHVLIAFVLAIKLRETMGDSSLSESAEPRVMVGILARNTAHSLSNFLGYMENLDYPKEKMLIWIRTTNGVDNTQSMVAEWAGHARDVYASVSYTHEEREEPDAEQATLKMTEEGYLLQVQLRQQGLEEARKHGVDYLLWMDCDNFLVNNQTLRLLIEQQKPLVAPMLEPSKDQAYSNFWCGQNEKGYYMRTPDYLPILLRKRVGCFKVPVIYGTMLIDLQSQASEGLVYWPAPDGFTGPVDDFIQFAYSAKHEGIDMFVLNTKSFGYIVRPDEHQKLEQYVNQFFNFKLQTLVHHPPVVYSQYLRRPSPAKDRLGVDKIYMINLERRPERRHRMLTCLDELHINFTLFNAVDGRQLNESYLNKLGISYLDGWKDPWGERPMTYGEVGCFLSHYFIWQQMLEDNHEKILILEDDIDFEPYFREDLVFLLSEAEAYVRTWDLIYIGRKILVGVEEILVDGSSSLVVPKYSYWTLGYLLSQRGARKLLDAKPLQKLLPVDEYLPIMFNGHPNKEWMSKFTKRDLNVYSASPLLINPTHYVGDDDWFSDTEPPLEELEKIRIRKLQTQKLNDEKSKGQQAHQKKIKEEALKRQIEAMKMKLKPKTEL